MRLWHEALIPHLPRQQLLGQHRECCALRGNGWGKKHSVVDYVFKYPYEKLYDYHQKVIKEMERRGYQVDPLWRKFEYRGKSCPSVKKIDLLYRKEKVNHGEAETFWIYPEHHQKYLEECLVNLERKGIRLDEFNGDKET